MNATIAKTDTPGEVEPAELDEPTGPDPEDARWWSEQVDHGDWPTDGESERRDHEGSTDAWHHQLAEMLAERARTDDAGL